MSSQIIHCKRQFIRSNAHGYYFVIRGVVFSHFRTRAEAAARRDAVLAQDMTL